MLWQLSIKRQMLLFALVIIVLMGGMGLLSLRVMGSNAGVLQGALQIKSLLAIDQMYTHDIEDSLYRFVLGVASKQEVLSHIGSAHQGIVEQWTLFKVRLETDDIVLTHQEELEWLINNSLREIDKLEALVVNGSLEQLKETIKAGWIEVYAPIIALIDTLLNELTDHAQQTLAYNAQRYVVELSIFLFFALCVLCASVWFVERNVSRSLRKVSRQLGELASGEADLSKRLSDYTLTEIREVSEAFNCFIERMGALIQRIKKSGEQVNSSTETIGATATDLEKTLHAFDASFVEAISTVKEISTTSQLLAETIEDVSAVSAKTVDLAQASKGSVAQMEKTIQQMAAASSQISHLLYVIKGKAEAVTKVVTSIGTIASKTHLLSLNAAIQSEKAGADGLGFAAVTREIRSLADHVADDSRHIEGMVNDMKDAVTAAVMEMDKFYNEVQGDAKFMQKVKEQLSIIIGEVETLGPRYDTVNRGVQEQVEGACRVGESIEEAARGAQEALRAFQYVNSVIKQLDTDSRDLQKSFSGFKLSC